MDNPSLTIALAMAVGVLAQAVARHARLPGIVLLLAVGVLLGPDVVNIVRPNTAGDALGAFVGFAVAIILFEGGLHMNIKKLRAQALPIRRLVTVGAVITGLAGAAAAWLCMGWGWKISLLFGTLVIVTGPTVITPLLRRLRVKRSVGTILEAEGIFIDAVGATIAVVALEVLLAPAAESWKGIFHIAERLGVGVIVGLAGGILLALLLSRRRLIPEGLENVLSLGFAVAIFQVSDAISHESGITAAIVGGMVVGNSKSHAYGEIVEFKEQLVSLLIATLFVLLAADVRLDTVFDLGWAGVFTVLTLMIVVRPITVFLSTFRTGLSLREKLFLSWLAPRGIVAAAVASLFAIELAAVGEPGGDPMRALVFLVIAMTVTIQGLTGGVVARLLGLKQKTDHGYVILGANPVARVVAKALRAGGEPVVLIDSNRDACEAARAEGFDVVFGNGLEQRTLDLAMAESRKAALSLTANESINFLFARKIKELYRGSTVYVGLETATSGVTSEMIETLDARVLFGGERHLQLWAGSIESDLVAFETWEWEVAQDDVSFASAPIDALLPVALRRGGSLTPIAASTKLRKGDRLRLVIAENQRELAHEWLRANGFVPISGRITSANKTVEQESA